MSLNRNIEERFTEAASMSRKSHKDPKREGSNLIRDLVREVNTPKTPNTFNNNGMKEDSQ